MVSLLRRLAWRLDWLRAAPALALARRSAAGPAIERDLARWRQCHELPTSWNDDRALVHLLAVFPEFRNLLEYRTRRENPILRGVAFRLRKPVETLILDIGELGPGLFIQHGFATIVAARRVGRNCWINQQVTIGFTRPDDRPTIGDDVFVYAGAKVLGDVAVGDGAVVGANAVVLEDVPPGATAVGVPARILPPKPARVAGER